MNPKLEKLLYLAEEQYLQSDQIETYNRFLAQLAEKVTVYETLRDQEIFVFKILADELQEEYPDETSPVLGEALSQWSLVLKYCSMAMLVDNRNYLTARIDNWLKEQIQMRAMPEMDKLLYDTLIEVLPEILLDQQVALIQPYLQHVNSLIELDAKKSEPLLAVG